MAAEEQRLSNLGDWPRSKNNWLWTDGADFKGVGQNVV